MSPELEIALLDLDAQGIKHSSHLVDFCGDGWVGFVRQVAEVQGMDLNAYVPKLQTEAGVAAFFRHHRGHPFASSALMDPMTRRFVQRIERFVQQQQVPLIRALVVPPLPLPAASEPSAPAKPPKQPTGARSEHPPTHRCRYPKEAALARLAELQARLTERR